MKLLKNKNVLLGVLISVLLVASYVNYKLFPSTTSPVSEEDNPNNAKLVGTFEENDIMSGGSIVSATFFTDYRMQRESTRSENISTLQDIVTNAATGKEALNAAQMEIIALTKLSEQEMLIENLIKAKGVSDCVVFIHSGYVNVVIDAKNLTEQQAIQIKDIVCSEISVDLAKVTIAASGR